MVKLFNRKNKKKGFTLIELIIVIAILAILAAVLIPSMVSYMDTANARVADSNAQTAHMAMAAAANIAKIDGDATPASGDLTATVGTSGITWDPSDAETTYATLTDEFTTLIGVSFSGEAIFTFDASGNLESTTWTAEAGGSPVGSYPVQP